jgi:hypothetical protein
MNAPIQTDFKNVLAAFERKKEAQRAAQDRQAIQPYITDLVNTLSKWAKEAAEFHFGSESGLATFQREPTYSRLLGNGWVLIELGGVCFMVLDSFPEGRKICIKTTCHHCGGSVPSRQVIDFADLYSAWQNQSDLAVHPTHRCY